MSHLLLVFAVCTLLSSCDGPQRKLINETRSPDGTMIARAFRDEPSGIGTGAADTQVDLNWTKGSQPSLTILVFNDGLDDPSGNKSLGMKWLTPTHFEVTYRGPRTIDFQAIKCHRIDISVRELRVGAAPLALEFLSLSTHRLRSGLNSGSATRLHLS
jgi:hypothetical protein